MPGAKSYPDVLEVRAKWSDTSAVTKYSHAIGGASKRSGQVILVVASELLICDTGFGGRSFGPVRFLLQAFPHGDKIGHFVVYGAIVFGISLLLRERVRAVGAAFVVFAVGAADEYRQLFVGGRNFDLNDVLANVGGICLGLVVGLFVIELVTRPHVSADDDPLAQQDPSVDIEASSDRREAPAH